MIDRGTNSSHAPPVGMRISVEAVIGELEAAGFSTRVLPQVRFARSPAASLLSRAARYEQAA